MSASSRRPGRSAASEPAAARSGAAARQQAAIAQSELRSAASVCGSGAAVEPHTSWLRNNDSLTWGRTAVLRAEHNECEQPLTRPVGGERARRRAVGHGGVAMSRDRAERAAINGEQEREWRGGRAAHELRTRAITCRARARTAHNEREQPPTRPVGGERARRRVAKRSVARQRVVATQSELRSAASGFGAVVKPRREKRRVVADAHGSAVRRAQRARAAADQAGRRRASPSLRGQARRRGLEPRLRSASRD